jgi:hypothetical protein
MIENRNEKHIIAFCISLSPSHVWTCLICSSSTRFGTFVCHLSTSNEIDEREKKIDYCFCLRTSLIILSLVRNMQSEHTVNAFFLLLLIDYLKWMMQYSHHIIEMYVPQHVQMVRKILRWWREVVPSFIVIFGKFYLTSFSTICSFFGIALLLSWWRTNSERSFFFQ